MTHHHTQTPATPSSTSPAVEYLFEFYFAGSHGYGDDLPLRGACLRVRGTTPAAAVARARSLLTGGLRWRVALGETANGGTGEEVVIHLATRVIAVEDIDRIQDPDSGTFVQVRRGDLRTSMTASKLAQLLEEYRSTYAPPLERVASLGRSPRPPRLPRWRSQSPTKRTSKRMAKRTTQAKTKSALRPARKKA